MAKLSDKQRRAMFAKGFSEKRKNGFAIDTDDRVETIEQISQEVLAERKGTVLGMRFNEDNTRDVIVQFDTSTSPHFVDPSQLKKLKETKFQHETKQKLCPVCQIRPRGSGSGFGRLCKKCLSENSAKKIRKIEQETFDTRVKNIGERLEEEGKTFKQIKKILQKELGDRPKSFTSEELEKIGKP